MTIRVQAAAGTPPVAGARLWWADVSAPGGQPFRWGVWAKSAAEARDVAAKKISGKSENRP